MKAEVLIVGDELLNGRIKDINGHWLACHLKEHGIDLARISIVHDQKSEMLAALNEAWKRSDIIITTGGIGPTQDDITKEVVAEFFNKKIEASDCAREIVLGNYERFGKEWNPDSNFYHMVPKDFTIVSNPTGLAPGLFYFSEGKALMSAPGVPRELQSMMPEEFQPLIDKHFKIDSEKEQQVVIQTKGIPEEVIFFELCPGLWEELEQFGKVSSLPQIMGIDILVTFKGTESDKKQKQKDIEKIISQSAISDAVWSWENKPLVTTLVEEAIAGKIKIALAESCTGGLAASRITDIPGASEIFMGSAVTYANEAKVDILGVNPQTIAEHGAVSEAVAEEMAVGALKKFHADVAVSFTGIAGPGGGSKEKPVGTVAVGIATKKGSRAKVYHYRGSRDYLKTRFSERGFFSLLSEIRKMN